ncbi:hypothetical protein ACIQNK_37925 [Streptomyces sp. NPDC091273]|uniref:hypothetical protein n=2 Tax=Streptomyces TaxID=1883 RepID=UPI0037F5B035
MSVSRWRDGAGEPTKAQAALLHKTFGAPPEPPKESTPPPLWTPEELRESMEQEKRSPLKVCLRLYKTAGIEVSERQVARWRNGERTPTDIENASLHKVFELR